TALPTRRRPLAHRVPADLVSPLVMGTRKRMHVLHPDDLLPHLKTRRDKACLSLASVESAVPDVRDRSIGQLVSLPPVGTVLVHERCTARRAARLAHPIPPTVINPNPVGRIGRHQRRLLTSQQL